jgi:hypothetical protein
MARITLVALSALLLAACGSGNDPAAPSPQKPGAPPAAPPPPPVEPGFGLHESFELVFEATALQENMKPKGEGFEPGGDWTVMDLVHKTRNEAGEFRIAFRFDADALKKDLWRVKGVGGGELVLIRTKVEVENGYALMKRFGAIFGAGLPPVPPKEKRVGRAACKLTVMGARFAQNQHGYVERGKGNWTLSRAYIESTSAEAEDGRLELFYFAVNVKDRRVRIAAQSGNDEVRTPLGHGREATEFWMKAVY